MELSIEDATFFKKISTFCFCWRILKAKWFLKNESELPLIRKQASVFSVLSNPASYSAESKTYIKEFINFAIIDDVKCEI